MSLVKYDEILNNCGTRKSFDTYGFNLLFKKYIFNWKQIILKRHHFFLESYINNKGNFLKMSKETGYSETDLKSIFLRIQSQFEIYDENNSAVFMDMVCNVQGLPIIAGDKEFDKYIAENKKLHEIKKTLENLSVKKSNKIIPINSNDSKIKSVDLIDYTDIKTIISELNCYLNKNGNASRSEKIKKYVEQFKRLENISEIEQYISNKAYKALILLINDKTIKEICEELNSQQSYLMCCILGRNNPRSKTEKGVLKLLETSIN